MHVRALVRYLSLLLLCGMTSLSARGGEPAAKPIRAGIIGLDTSHVMAFTQCINDPKAAGDLAGVRIVAAFPGGSPDIPDSWNRVKDYTDQIRRMGVRIVPSIDDLLKQVDVVLLESVDGRPHLAQARPVIAARKPLYVDKPMAGSLADVIEIFRLAREANVPCFSASSLRFTPASRLRGTASSARSSSAPPGVRCTWRSTTPTCSGTASTAWRRSLRSWARGARP